MAAGKKEEVDDEEVAAAAAAAKQKKKKLFLFIGIGVLLVFFSIGGTVLALKLLGPKHPGSEAQASDSESSEAEEVSESDEPPLPASYYPLKPNFTVNYDVNGRQRFLQAELTLMYRDEAILKTLELHMPAVRNGLVLLLSSQTFDELQTPEGKEKLRAAALKTVQDILEKERAAAAEKDKDKEKPKSKKPAPTIEQVLFTNFVMQ